MKQIFGDKLLIRVDVGDRDRKGARMEHVSVPEYGSGQLDGILSRAVWKLLELAVQSLL